MKTNRAALNAANRNRYEAMGPMGFEVALIWPLALVTVTSEKT